MSAEKSLAIVLRTIEFSETSVVTTLFTEKFGKISALAKGARRPKGPFESALDLLAVVRIVFLHKSSGALDLLTEAKLERRFRAAARDLSRLYAGYYVAELLTELTDEGDPHADLFSAADAALARLDEGAPVAPTVLDFELTALNLLGHLPSLHDCVGCGNLVEAVGRVAFGLVVGGVLCSACRPGQRQVVSISAPALVAMRKLTAETESHAEPAELEPKVGGELRGILSGYLAHLLGHKLKMHDYLKTLA
jgi:DNA repair protein RecO (recombination protein O)